MSAWGIQSPHTCVCKEGETAQERAANSSYLFPELGCNLGEEKNQIRVTNAFGETKFCVNHSPVQV